MYGNNYGYNPYLNNMNRFQPQPMVEQNIQPTSTQTYIPPVQINKSTGLLGKPIDSIESAKVVEFPLDGSTSYFPLTDGSAIVTKQLKADGTSKTTVYKPIEEEKEENLPKYVTIEELKKSLREIDLSDIDKLWDELNDLKRDLKDLKETKKK